MRITNIHMVSSTNRGINLKEILTSFKGDHIMNIDGVVKYLNSIILRNGEVNVFKK